MDYFKEDDFDKITSESRCSPPWRWTTSKNENYNDQIHTIRITVNFYCHTFQALADETRVTWILSIFCF